MPGRGPTGQVVVNITSVTIVLDGVPIKTCCRLQPIRKTSAGVSNENPSTTSNAATGTGGEKLSSQKVNELPLNGRDFSALLLLAAGTMTDVNGQTNFTQQFAINGQRGVEAVFAMDGADVSDPEMGRKHVHEFRRRCDSGVAVKLRLGCRRTSGAAAAGFAPTS